ncbi:hypothetical protein [Streptodolium elevatio]|uniref:DUF4262 domain-containing protein n=1 Tax=Streptodolium elevatio TaxID=3157996 RepID=A0ABV3DL37_9ACTN
MIDAYPFADGQNLAWELIGFGPDEQPRSCVGISRAQFIAVRHLFDVEGDEWMMSGVYAVPPGVWDQMRGVLGSVELVAGVDYFLGACQDLPDGRVWLPSRDGDVCPAPVPPPGLSLELDEYEDEDS